MNFLFCCVLHNYCFLKLSPTFPAANSPHHLVVNKCESGDVVTSDPLDIRG